MKVYQHIAQCLQAMENCRARDNVEWFDKHTATVIALCDMYLPSGSGFDNGTQIDLEASTPNKLMFNTSYHHMDDAGSYEGWSDHSVVITPDLATGFSVKVAGKDRNDIKDYIGEAFSRALDIDASRADYCRACGVDPANDPLVQREATGE
jgi:hypothetical protein